MNLTHIVTRLTNRKGKEVEATITEDGCHICTSHPPNPDGYVRLYAGKFKLPKCQFLHRIRWEFEKGPIPEGYEVDHICRNRACCNPDHLQLLSKSEHKTKGNILRYKERIKAVKEDILAGYTNKHISNKHLVTVEYVNRYRRSLKGTI